MHPDCKTLSFIFCFHKRSKDPQPQYTMQSTFQYYVTKRSILFSTVNRRRRHHQPVKWVLNFSKRAQKRTRFTKIPAFSHEQRRGVEHVPDTRKIGSAGSRKRGQMSNVYASGRSERPNSFAGWWASNVVRAHGVIYGAYGTNSWCCAWPRSWYGRGWDLHLSIFPRVRLWQNTKIAHRESTSK